MSEIKALCISDSVPLAEELSAMLKTSGIASFRTESTRHAQDVIRAHHTSFIFYDLDLRDRPVDEAIRLLVGENPQVQIAVVSHGGIESRCQQAINAGAHKVLDFPFKTEALKAVLNGFYAELRRRQVKQLSTGSFRSAALALELETHESALTPAVEAISRLIDGLVSQRDLLRIQLALHEVLRNAYEHGNLGVSNKEKAQLCEDGTFEKVLGERAEVARAKGKVIRVNAEVAKNIFTCSVHDQGKGFDWKKQMNIDPTDPEALLNLHGRGLLLIQRTFHEVKYNRTGNKITLRKRL